MNKEIKDKIYPKENLKALREAIIQKMNITINKDEFYFAYAYYSGLVNGLHFEANLISFDNWKSLNTLIDRLWNEYNK